MRNLKKHYSFLDVVINTKPKQRVALIKTASSQQIAVLIEILVNILKRVLPISAEHLEQLYKYKRALRRLKLKALATKEKKALFLKYKDLIPVLYQPVFPLLKSLAQDHGS